MNLNDKEQVKILVRGCKKGDRKCQRALYETLYPKMLGVCLRYSRDTLEAEDFVQDGFIKVFDKIKSFNFKGSLEGWVRRLIVNNCIDEIRRKRKMYFEYGEESHINNLKDESYDELENEKLLKLQADRIVELIQKLTPGYQTVFNLYVVEDLTHKQIADLLDVNVGTSKSNYAKAKRKLRELYNKEFGHENTI
ncbi:MAG: RNA polymerase sigma factor [Bacteroidota bacterium]|nr:RNA polymerase sigma factor [Bacteroidota bacterium]